MLRDASSPSGAYGLGCSELASGTPVLHLSRFACSSAASFFRTTCFFDRVKLSAMACRSHTIVGAKRLASIADVANPAA